MKSKILSLIVTLATIALTNELLAQEKDDMYFSRRDRAQLYTSTSYTTHSGSNSEYAANHNFYSSTIQSTTAGSPTVQANGNAEDDNNQYFIKDYSIKNKTDNEVKTYAGINSNNGFYSGHNVILSYQAAYYGRLYYPLGDPFSSYYDPFYRYRSASYYGSYRYDPWRYNNYEYGSNYNYYPSYYNSSNVCVSTSYSNNVRNEVRYRNGRKIISGSRTSRTINRTAENVNEGRAVKNTGSKVSTNGRSSNGRTDGTYRTYQSKNQSRSYNRNNSNSSNFNRNTNTRNSNSFRRSGSSSPSKSYSSGSKSSGSRSSSSGSRSSGSSSRSKGRGN